MQTFFRLFTVLAAIGLLLAPPVATAQEAKKATKADAPAKGKDLYPPAFFDFMLKQRLAQGQPDSPELRAALRDELNTLDFSSAGAKKQGLDRPQAEMDFRRQPARSPHADYEGATVPVTCLRKEYHIRTRLRPGNKVATSWSRKSTCQGHHRSLPKGYKFEKPPSAPRIRSKATRRSRWHAHRNS